MTQNTKEVINMKKYVSFTKKANMREFIGYTGYFRASRYQMNILPEDWEDKLPHSSQLTPVSWLFSLNGRAPCQAKSFRAAFEIVCFNDKKNTQVIYIAQFYKSNADSHNYKMKRK
jgi:hypothetical protein